MIKMDKFILDLLEGYMTDLRYEILHKAEQIVKKENEIKADYKEVYNIMFKMRNLKESLEQQEIDIGERFFHLVDLDNMINLKRKGW